MLIGIVITTIIGLIIGLIPYHGVFSLPPSMEPTFFKLDIVGALSFDLMAIVFTFLILDLFDTIGTLIGVASEANLMKDGKLPHAEKALLSDAIGTVVGSLSGTSTVTSYIESVSGITSGAKSGLANVFTALLFILAIFFYPLIQMIGEGITNAEGMIRYPAVAPVLILIGLFMMKSIRNIKWDDFSVSIPAFLTFLIIPFSFSPTEGIAFGFISFAILKLVSGQAKSVHLLMWIFALIFLIRYLFIGVT